MYKSIAGYSQQQKDIDAQYKRKIQRDMNNIRRLNRPNK